MLHDVEGLDARESAAALGIARSALERRLHRARQALRSLLEPYVLADALPTRPGASG